MNSSTGQIAAAAALAALLTTVPSTAVAQAPAAAAPPPATDYRKVEIKTPKLASNFYTLEGAGGTIGVLTGPDGVFMVDSQFAPLTDKIVAAIKQISDGRLRLLAKHHIHPHPPSRKRK